MNNKKVLITGGAGFIGSSLIRQIQEKYPKCEIIVLDNLFTGRMKNVPKNVRFIIGNTWDINTWSKTLHLYPDIVFHFGEYSRISQSFDDIDYVMDSNLRGTAAVLEYCINNGAKLVYSASSSKFGNDGKDEHLSPYAWTKSKMVELIKNYEEWYGLEYEICYFFNVYGPGQISTGNYATVVGIFEQQYKDRKTLTVVEPGTQSRDFTHIDDIVSGIIASVEKNLNGEWYLRSGKAYNLIQLAEMFQCDYTFLPKRKGDRKHAVWIDSDTNEKLEWEPKYKLSDYVRTFINENKYLEV